MRRVHAHLTDQYVAPGRLINFRQLNTYAAFRSGGSARPDDSRRFLSRLRTSYVGRDNAKAIFY